jgi:hypothetical protein
VGVLVFIPVVGLAGFHIGLVCLGRTTNEHVTGKFRNVHNPYDLGCCRNCWSILCSPKKPRYMHYKAKPFVLSSSGGGEGGRAASYTPRSATNTTRPVNDLRCMPVYEELDGADDLLPTRPQLLLAANSNNQNPAAFHSAHGNPIHTLQQSPQQRRTNGLSGGGGEGGGSEVTFSGGGHIVMAEVTV